MTQATDPAARAGTWRDVGSVVAAHLVMLRDAGFFDEAVLAALLTALDGTARGRPPEVASLADLVGAFDERLDALSPAGAVGAGAVGRARPDVVATVVRLAARDGLLALAAELGETRHVLLDFAAAHTVTLIPAHLDGATAQPTTLAHLLTGAVGPLGRLGARLPGVWAEVNRSPMGAGSLASTGLGIDRERVAGLLGCDGPVVSTYDALAATDHLAATADAVAGIAATARRLLGELLTWVRAEPSSFRLGDDWLGFDPALPQLRAPAGLVGLVAAARGVEADAAAAAERAQAVGYGPVGAAIDGLQDALSAPLAGASRVLAETRRLLADGLEVNRAYLANRAGKGFSTSSELADFLLVEEGVDPGAARDIAALVVAKAASEGIEASGITREMIDASALLVIGREVGIEIEALSRYLAPRRFVERRAATGAPSPTATRAYLDQERLRLAADERWREEAVGRLAAAGAELDRLTSEALAAVDPTGRA